MSRIVSLQGDRLILEAIEGGQRRILVRVRNERRRSERQQK